MDDTEEEVEIELETEENDDSNNHNYNLRRRSGGSATSSGSGSASANRVRLNRIPGMPGIIARLIQAVTNNEEGSEDSSDDSDFDPENVEEPAFFWPSTRRKAPKEKSPPKPKAEWVEKLKESDFYEETVLGLGENLDTCHRFRVKSNLLNVIKNREVTFLYIF